MKGLLILLTLLPFFCFSQLKDVDITIKQYRLAPGAQYDPENDITETSKPQLVIPFKAYELNITQFDQESIRFENVIHGKRFKIFVRTGLYDSSKHHYDAERYTIDGKKYFGTDGGVPSSEIKEYTIEIDGKKVAVPDEAYKQHFNLYVYSYGYPTFRSYYVPEKDLLFLTFMGSDGAGAYHGFQIWYGEHFGTNYYSLLPFSETVYETDKDFFSTDKHNLYKVTFEKLDRSKDATYIRKDEGDVEFLEAAARQDLSELLKSDTTTYGAFGEQGKLNEKDIFFFITYVKKDQRDPLLYHVEGKDVVDGIVSAFKGTLKLMRALKIKKPYPNNESQRVLLLATYELKEFANSKGAGMFKGTFRQNRLIIEKPNDIKWLKQSYPREWIGIFINNKTKGLKSCGWSEGGNTSEAPWLKEYWWR
jgi:hypothetical protein